MKFCKIVLHPMEKSQVNGNYTWFFLKHHYIYSFFNLWKFYMLFLWYPYLEISGISKNVWKYYFKGIKKSFSCFIKVIFYLKRDTLCVRVRCFKNDFSELTGSSSPQTSPGLYAGVNGRDNLSAAIARHSSMYGLSPLSITLEMSDLQIFG